MADVRLVCRRWIGTREAEPGEANETMLVEDVLINGVSLEQLRVDELPRPCTPAEAFAMRPVVSLQAEGFLSVVIVRPPAALREMFADPATHLLGSTDERLELPVSELVVNPYGVSAEVAA